MKKKLADEIGKAFIRLHCPHLYWHRESPLAMGSFSRGVIVCNNCGKRKFIEQLKDSEVLVEPWRYKDYLTNRERGIVMTKKEEMLTEVLRKTRGLMLESIMEESGKIELIHKKIAEYPAPVIPKKEALEIINRAMEGSEG